MKGYFITDEQMKDLHRRIELHYSRAATGHDTGVRTFEDLYRSINYAVHEWQTEVGKK